MRADRARHLRQFQHGGRRRERHAAAGLGLIYDTLMASSLDEVSTEYGLLAEAVSYPDDFSSATYRLRAEAKWHDGKPVTPEDVIFSFDAFKKNSPQLRAYYRHVVKVEKTGEREITFTFDAPGQSRTAADRRPAHVLPQALVGRHRQERQQARHRQHHARAAARLRPLPHQGVLAGPQRRLRARQRLLGQGPQRQCRHATISTNCSYEYFRDTHGRARSLQGRQGRLAHRKQRQELGHRLRLPGGAATSASSRRNFRSAISA